MIEEQYNPDRTILTLSFVSVSAEKSAESTEELTNRHHLPTFKLIGITLLYRQGLSSRYPCPFEGARNTILPNRHRSFKTPESGPVVFHALNLALTFLVISLRYFFHLYMVSLIL